MDRARHCSFLTDKERDAETGLDYFVARYYSSPAGRFTSPDSRTGSSLMPQTLNLYAYSRNNPLKFIDPTGHWALTPAEQGKRDSQMLHEWRRNYWDNYYRQLNYQVLIASKMIVSDNDVNWSDGGSNTDNTNSETAPQEPANPLEEVDIQKSPDGKSWEYIFPRMVLNLGDDLQPYIKHGSYGTGACAQFPQILSETLPNSSGYTGIGEARTWREGARVYGNESMRRGTIIATFDEHGLYANKTSGNHVAIFLEHVNGGFKVLEQVRGKVQINIIDNPKSSYYKNPLAYYIIRPSIPMSRK